MLPVNRREFLAQAGAASVAAAAIGTVKAAPVRSSRERDHQSDPGQDRDSDVVDRDGNRQHRLGPGEQPDETGR